MRLGLIVHLGKELAVKTAGELIKTLPNRGVRYFLSGNR